MRTTTHRSLIEGQVGSLPLERCLFRKVICMHIGINAQLLSFSQNYRNGGISRYIRYLLTELAKRPGEHEYTIFVNGLEVIEYLRDLVGSNAAYLSRKGEEHSGQTQITYVPVSLPESKPTSRVAWEQLK